VGSDGLVLILPSEKYDIKLRMFNATAGREDGGNAPAASASTFLSGGLR
jgi:diaminopimelate epimerase